MLTQSLYCYEDFSQAVNVGRTSSVVGFALYNSTPRTDGEMLLFPCSYMMSNGYKPSPLDLSDIKLSPGQELLVDKLAENAHNVWAKDRIKQGWTYGIQQVCANPLMYRTSAPKLKVILSRNTKRNI